jgi:hypothetical protein
MTELVGGTVGTAGTRLPAALALRRSASTVFASSLTVGAVALWAVSLPAIDLRRMNDLGLASVLPPMVYVAFALLSASFWLGLRNIESRRPLVAANVLILVVVVYGLPSIIEHETRLTAAWRHTGVIETIARTGHVNPSIDAYFDWPGFFMLGAFVTKTAGLSSAITLARWAPIVINLLFLPALLVIFRTATRDERTVWLALWIFYSADWIGQDYFSPQAAAFFLYLASLALLLRWFVRSDPPRGLRARFRLPRTAGDETGPLPAETELTSKERALLMGVTVAVIAVMAPMHQLTPFALLLSLTVLAIAKRTPARGLPLVTAVVVGTWLAFMAVAYIKGHLNVLTSEVGQLGPTVQSNVSSRVSGSALHQDVATERLLFTGCIWGAAALGAIRSFRAGRPYFTFLLLAISPFALVVLQPYGGEVLLRIYLFSLPFTAFFAASVIVPAAGERLLSWPTVAVAALAGFALLVGLVVARNGNERAEYFTRGDVSTVRELYRLAPPGSLLLAGAANLPWRYKGYDQYTYAVLGPNQWMRGTARNEPTSAVASVEALMRSRPPGRSFLILTRSEAAYLELFGTARRGTFHRFELALLHSTRLRRVYDNGDGSIFVLARRSGA